MDVCVLISTLRWGREEAFPVGVRPLCLTLAVQNQTPNTLPEKPKVWKEGVSIIRNSSDRGFMKAAWMPQCPVKAVSVHSLVKCTMDLCGKL